MTNYNKNLFKNINSTRTTRKKHLKKKQHIANKFYNNVLKFFANNMNNRKTYLCYQSAGNKNHPHNGTHKANPTKQANPTRQANPGLGQVNAEQTDQANAGLSQVNAMTDQANAKVKEAEALANAIKSINPMIMFTLQKKILYIKYIFMKNAFGIYLQMFPNIIIKTSDVKKNDKLQKLPEKQEITKAVDDFARYFADNMQIDKDSPALKLIIDNMWKIADDVTHRAVEGGYTTIHNSTKATIGIVPLVGDAILWILVITSAIGNGINAIAPMTPYIGLMTGDVITPTTVTNIGSPIINMNNVMENLTEETYEAMEIIKNNVLQQTLQAFNDKPNSQPSSFINALALPHAPALSIPTLPMPTLPMPTLPVPTLPVHVLPHVPAPPPKKGGGILSTKKIYKRINVVSRRLQKNFKKFTKKSY